MTKATIKKWYQSKLIWVGVITILAAIGDAALSGFGWRHVVVAAIGALVTYLRSVTVDTIDFGD